MLQSTGSKSQTWLSDWTRTAPCQFSASRFASIRPPSSVWVLIKPLPFLILLFKFICLFWLCWVFFVACGLSPWCAGFSLQWLLLLRNTGSRRSGFSSCSTGAHQLWLKGPRGFRLRSVQHRTQQLWLPGSRTQALLLWQMGLVIPQHRESSMDWIYVSCISRWILIQCYQGSPKPPPFTQSLSHSPREWSLTPPFLWPLHLAQLPLLWIISKNTLSENGFLTFSIPASYTGVLEVSFDDSRYHNLAVASSPPHIPPPDSTSHWPQCSYWVGHPFSSLPSLRSFLSISAGMPLPRETSSLCVFYPKPASLFQFSSVQSLSCVQHPMDCSMLGLPVHHQLPEFTQTHVHWVSDAIQPSHPLSSPSPTTFNLSQHQGLFKWVSSWHQVAKVLEFQLQHQSFQWIFRTDFL